MAKKILRQGLRVTPKELRELADELEKDFKKGFLPLGYSIGIEKVVFQINIINKTPKCSDTWEIEK